jgi:hypothetical protein
VLTLCVAIGVGTAAGLVAWKQFRWLYQPHQTGALPTSPSDVIAAAWRKNVGTPSLTLSDRQLRPLSKRFSCCGIVVLRAIRRNNGAVLVAAGAWPQYRELLAYMDRVRNADLLLVVTFRGQRRMVASIRNGTTVRAWVAPDLLRDS